MTDFTISEIETYLRCPFQYYATSVLGIQAEPQEDPELNPAEMGSLLHRVLQKFLQKGGRDSKALLLQLASDEFEKIRHKRENLIPVLLQAQKRRVERTLISFLEKEGSGTSGLRPTHFEWSFGKNTPPLTIPDGGGGSIRISGRIDRIDVDHKNKRFLVIDYKTGAQKITGNQIRRAESLQLPLYLMAVQSLLLPDYQPIGALYYHLSDLSLENGILHSDRLPPDLEIHPRSSSIVPPNRWDPLFENMSERVRSLVSEIRLKHFPPRKDSCEPWCPFQEVCQIRVSKPEPLPT